MLDDESTAVQELEKEQDLAMKVGTRAERLVKSYPLTEANYPKVIEALKDRFGDKVILTEVYVRQLLKLVINNQNSSFLYPLVESSLPEELIRVWQRSDMAGYAKDEGELIPSVDQRLRSLLAFVRREVKGEQRIAYLKDGFGDSSRKRDTGHYVTGTRMDLADDGISGGNWRVLPLADPHFEKSGKVDVILGADVYGKLLFPDLRL
ncbi:hypothetical protein LAZ67_22001235 [Cordylochernes scorpioides]|uniref:Uncharacterized protein n=1 Tax=Cordylochernes scorpioides TaxID=51811 RepID=A0ABY6LNU4_9ARAC|nr:hypothetical protein LAZ67_22001235 [Cordylochernes scorpioides]